MEAAFHSERELGESPKRTGHCNGELFSDVPLRFKREKAENGCEPESGNLPGL